MTVNLVLYVTCIYFTGIFLGWLFTRNTKPERTIRKLKAEIRELEETNLENRQAYAMAIANETRRQNKKQAAERILSDAIVKLAKEME